MHATTERAGTIPLLLMFSLMAPLPVAAQVPLDPVQIAARAQAATVDIEVLDERGRARGAGSGFVVSGDGLVVTSFHVIHRAHALRIGLPEGAEHTEVYFVAADPRHDVAVLKIDAEGLQPLALGDRATLVVGQRIFTMGHPLGQTATFSDGLVSALREIEDVSVVQITAPISTGSSGGPVMNEAGEVVAIATMMLRGGQNLNFAVPARYVRPLLESAGEPRPFSASALPTVQDGILALGSDGSPRARRGGARGAPAFPAAPADPWEAQVLRQVQSIDSALTAAGVAERTHALDTGALEEGETESLAIELDAGTPYVVVGVCDEDCTEVRLRLFTPDDTLLGSEDSVSHLPYVLYQPQTSGTYRLEVTMSGCGVAPCRYAVASYVVR